MSDKGHGDKLGKGKGEHRHHRHRAQSPDPARTTQSQPISHPTAQTRSAPGGPGAAVFTAPSGPGATYRPPTLATSAPPSGVHTAGLMSTAPLPTSHQHPPPQQYLPPANPPPSQVSAPAAQQQQQQQQQHPRFINEADWFSFVAGCGEETLSFHRERHIISKHYAQLPWRSASQHLLHIRNKDTGAEFSAGMFFLASLKELKASLVPAERAVQCVFEVCTRTDPVSTRFVDVAALQADPANAGAMFQAASNFNGVEAISDNAAPDSPNFTEYYIYDRTQGPAASVSAPAAAIARVHAAFFDPAKPPSTWGQTATRQLQMLEQLAPYYTVQNGYIVNGSNESHPEQPLPTDPAHLQHLLDEAKIGIHLSVDVIFGERTQQGMRVVEKPHKIHQVFCAAMNVSQGPNGMRNGSLPDARSKAAFLLRIAYQGAYLAALATGCRKLYLTMIGGGVFGNDFGDIFNEILIAHKLFALSSFNRSLVHVYLVLYSPPPGREQFIDRLKQESIPFQSVTYSDNTPTIECTNLQPQPQQRS